MIFNQRPEGWHNYYATFTDARLQQLAAEAALEGRKQLTLCRRFTTQGRSFAARRAAGFALLNYRKAASFANLLLDRTARD